MKTTNTPLLSRPQDLTRLRRIALAAQGLIQSQAFGSGLAGACKAINHLGYVQIDTIAVVERAHHHVLYSRVPKFCPSMTNQMLIDGDIFEYWAHAAAFLPIVDFRFSLPYKQAIKDGKTHWYKNPDRKLMSELLAKIRSEGALRSRDLEAKSSKSSGWWDWKPTKKALEQLYMEGDLMVSKREGFQKAYDLTERVLPAGINTEQPSTKEFARHILDQQLRCHGLVSLKGLTYQRRNPELRKAVKVLVNEGLAEGVLEQVQVQNGEMFLFKAGLLESRLPRLSKRLYILSPFDNSVIQRDRLRALFQYDYQIECYLPEEKRRYGYFCLPLLYGDTFIGRVDCKAHRKNSELEIKSLYLQHHSVDEELIIDAFAEAMVKFCRFQNCLRVSLTKAEPRHLTQAIRKALTEKFAEG